MYGSLCVIFFLCIIYEYGFVEIVVFKFYMLNDKRNWNFLEGSLIFDYVYMEMVIIFKEDEMIIKDCLYLNYCIGW